MADNVRNYKLSTLASYRSWKSLPATLRGLSPDVLRRMGIGDSYSQELLSLRDQRDFARHFQVSERTLTRWNREFERDGSVEEALKWARPLTPNVIFALYRRIMATGKPKEVSLWLELVEGSRRNRGEITLSQLMASASGPNRTDASSE